jgi:hypothetical protein
MLEGIPEKHRGFYMKNVLFCSGGKDSVASLILAKWHGEPLDGVVFCEVMFDEETSGEHPLHIEFVKEKLRPWVEKELEIPFVILRSDRTYKSCFEHIISRGKGEGKTAGFPIPGLCAINRECKMRPIQKFRKENNIELEYVGIAKDEPERLARLTGNKVSLLAKYGFTEAMAKELCIEFDLISPIYGICKRNGCWFCMNCKDNEFVWLIKNRPDLFNKLIELEGKHPNRYRECLTRDETPSQLKARLEVYTNQLSFFEQERKNEECGHYMRLTTR